MNGCWVPLTWAPSPRQVSAVSGSQALLANCLHSSTIAEAEPRRRAFSGRAWEREKKVLSFLIEIRLIRIAFWVPLLACPAVSRRIGTCTAGQASSGTRKPFGADFRELLCLGTHIFRALPVNCPHFIAIVEAEPRRQAFPGRASKRKQRSCCRPSATGCPTNLNWASTKEFPYLGDYPFERRIDLTISPGISRL